MYSQTLCLIRLLESGELAFAGIVVSAMLTTAESKRSDKVGANGKEEM